MAPIEVTRQDHIAIITLNRPARRNALSLAMWRELPDIMRQLEQDDAVRCIFLTGAGGSFSAGADISEFDTVRATVEQAIAYEKDVDACGDAIEAISKPTIAVIDGFCIGGACHLALACDFRFAATGASFAIPAARLSIVYGVTATRKLMSVVGLVQAKRVLYSAQRFSADEGHEMGFFDNLSDDPMHSAREFADEIAQNAPLSAAGAKKILNGLSRGMQSDDPTGVETAINRAIDSDDYREGRDAFAQKRAPVFTGC